MKESIGRFPICTTKPLSPITEIKKVVLWPSKLDLVEKCPASAETDDLSVIIDEIGPEANIGQAIHEVARRVVSGEQIELDKEYLKSIAVRHGVEDNIDDILSLSGAVVSAWGSLKKYFRSPLSEESNRVENVFKNPHTQEDVTVILSGKHDVYEIFDVNDIKEALIKKWGISLDWKSGRKSDDSAYRSQMLAYAYLMLAKDSGIEQVTSIIVWLRDRTYSVVTFKKDEILEWFNTFIKRSAFWDGKTFKPGDHCLWCKRFYICPARIQMVSSAIRIFSGSEKPELSMILNPDGSLVDSDKLYSAYTQGKVLEKLLDSFFKQLREEVIKRGSVVVRSVAGKDFGFYTKLVKGGSYVDPIKSWEILEETFNRDELAEIVEVSASKIHKAAMAKAAKGDKKKFADSIIGKLTDIGAITTAPDVKRMQTGEIEK